MKQSNIHLLIHFVTRASYFRINLLQDIYIYIIFIFILFFDGVLVKPKYVVLGK